MDAQLELKQLAERFQQSAATVAARADGTLLRAAEEGIAAGYTFASQAIADRYYVLFGERLPAIELLSIDNP